MRFRGYTSRSCNRRLILARIIKGLSLLPFAYLVGCGSDSDSSSDTPSEDDPVVTDSCDLEGTGASISYLNPGHDHTALTLDSSIIENETPGSYVLMSGSHDHNFTLTAQNLIDLKTNGTLEIDGDDESHGHSISLTCV